MAEWLYEAGIGEARAALVEDGEIVAVRVELQGALRLGTVARAWLTEITVKGREGVVTLKDGREALLSPLPSGITQGASLTIEIVREAIPEPGRAKRPRAAATEVEPLDGTDLFGRIIATGHVVRRCLPHEPDRLEAAGWSEVLEEARTGEIAFSLGALRLSPTPAMALFDVDGSGPAEPLAIAAATAVAKAIVRHAIGGSIGVDFPTLAGKAPRQAVAAAIDAALPQPFERTAVNGFGFLQIVRPRPRASLPEILRSDSTAAEARALLRQIERIPPPAPRTHCVRPRVHAVLMAHPDWLAELDRRTGAANIFEMDSK